jgi:uncharacterized protein YjaZ
VKKDENEMPVKKTHKTLRKICQKSEGKPRKDIAAIQRERIAEPLTALFPDTPAEAIYFELLQNGLLEPHKWTELKDIVETLEEKNVWELTEKEYSRLRNIWHGPEVDIYIYPLTKKRPAFNGIKPNKNGVAYRKALFLFVTPELKEQELYALLAHEYHHICRLAHLGTSPAEHSLKESLVIEGMAEAAVEELYGEEWLSPWAQRYSLEEAKKIWERQFIPALEIKGLLYHRPFLYGDRKRRLPPWIGYSIGYRIVRSYLQNNESIEQENLYKLSAEEIIQGSDFSV